MQWRKVRWSWGEGSLGGKARGLAFINSTLQKYNEYNKYADVRIIIPRTVVVATDYFDQFIKDNIDTEEEIYIIGGGTIYQMFLPYAKHLYLTEVDASAPDADVFFPSFDKSSYSQTLIRKGTENDLNYSIIKYIKN